MAEKGCPSGLATSKPGREGWALEELWDIVIEADANGRVEPTRFRGVYLLYADPARLAAVAVKATPAFLKSIMVTGRCLTLRKDAQILSGSKADLCCSMIRLRLRGSSKRLEAVIVEELRCEQECVLYIEGIDDFILIARSNINMGPKKCGYNCTLVVDELLVSRS